MRKNTPKNKNKQFLISLRTSKQQQRLYPQPVSPEVQFMNVLNRHEKNFGKRTVLLQNFRLLENKVKRLEGIIEILQTASCRASVSLNIKLCS